VAFGYVDHGSTSALATHRVLFAAFAMN
jgi:hypothetical protein